MAQAKLAAQHLALWYALKRWQILKRAVDNPHQISTANLYFHIDL